MAGFDVVDGEVISQPFDAHRVRFDAVDAAVGSDAAGGEQGHHADVGADIEHLIALVDEELVEKLAVEVVEPPDEVRRAFGPVRQVQAHPIAVHFAGDDALAGVAPAVRVRPADEQ